MRYDDYIKNGYTIENAKIVDADFSMEDHGCLVFRMHIRGARFEISYGGSYCIGHGYLGANEFDGSSKGLEMLMRIMDVVGVERMSDIKNKYIRFAYKGFGGSVSIIGNIIEDKWFDQKEFFDNDKSDNA